MPRAELTNIHVHSGQHIICPNCGEIHELRLSLSRETGEQSDALMWYKCGKTAVIAAVDGRLLGGLELVKETL